MTKLSRLFFLLAALACFSFQASLEAASWTARSCTGTAGTPPNHARGHIEACGNIGDGTATCTTLLAVAASECSDLCAWCDPELAWNGVTPTCTADRTPSPWPDCTGQNLPPYLFFIDFDCGCNYIGGSEPVSNCDPVCGCGYHEQGYGEGEAGCVPDSSPILINLDNSGNDHLTSAANGVAFDINADGTMDQVAWTQASSNVAFLVLDRNGDGSINSGRELFGDSTLLSNGNRAPNGFVALREFDTSGDGKITAADPTYAQLRLWIDANHNGVSEGNELHNLPSAGVTSIGTDYVETRRVDQHGNQYRWASTALILEQRLERPRRIFDVIFLTQQGS